LNLPEHDHYTPEAPVDRLKNAMVTTFETASVRSTTGASANTIHRFLQKTRPEIEAGDPSYALVNIDTTNVP
jgi:hypothetical protein